MIDECEPRSDASLPAATPIAKTARRGKRMANRLGWYAVHALDEQRITAGLSGEARGLRELLKIAMWPHTQHGKLSMPLRWWLHETGFSKAAFQERALEVQESGLLTMSDDGKSVTVELHGFAERAIADREAARKAFGRDADKSGQDSDKSGQPTDKSGPTVRNGTERKEETALSPSGTEGAVFEHYLSLGHRAAWTTKRRRLIRARLDEKFTEDELKRSLDGFHASPFHRGENDRKTVYLDLELLFRDAKHVEEGLELANGPPTKAREQTLAEFRAGKEYL